MNSNSGMVVTFVRMSSLFIRYRTILSESRRGKKKENLVNIPVIVHRIFRVLASILPPPLPWYLLLWPRSNRFGCAPFHYFILFSFFFFFENRWIQLYMDGFEIEKEQLCAWHTAVTCVQRHKRERIGAKHRQMFSFLVFGYFCAPFDARAIIRLIDIGISSDKSARFFN